MKKEGKRITRWKTGTTKLQGAAYLREMAENGWILEDMNHLMYTFREDEPQYLKYRILERDCVMALEEREMFEKDGWTEVCHYELEYVFVKERELFEEDSEEEKELVLEELDRKIKLERENEKNSRYGQLIVVGIGVIAFFLMFGFSKDTFGAVGILAVKLLPWIFIGFVLSQKRLRKLKKKKAYVLEGDISDEYTDWRKQKHKGTIGGLIGFLIIGWAVCIGAEWNQKKYDLPVEVSYRDIPAVRLENLEEGTLERIGKNINTAQEQDSLYFKLNQFHNYVIDHRCLLIAEKVEMNQCVKKNDTEINMDVEYHNFMLKFLAERQYQDDLEWEREKPSAQYGMEEHHIITETPKGNFDELHICRTELGNEELFHILCREDSQVMEVNYDGQADADDILMEVQRVFLAQK